MQPTRRARMESVIRDELSMIISRELKDPRIPSLSVTSVSVASDGSHANIFVAPLDFGPAPETEEDFAERERRMRDAIEGLTSASGFMRRHLAKVLQVRNIPTLSFKADRGLQNSMRVHELLKEISPEKKGEDQDPGEETR